MNSTRIARNSRERYLALVEVEREIRRRTAAAADPAAAEFAACRRDLVRFINGHCVIDDVHGDDSAGSDGLMPFRLWPAQEALARRLPAEPRLVILKARQLGISWLVCAYVLHLCLMNPGKVVLLFSQGQMEAEELLRRVSVLYHRLGEGFRAAGPSLIKGNMGVLAWSHGSRVESLPATQRAGRSFTASLVIMDEAAHMRYGGRLFAAAKPTMADGGQLIVLSTADGAGGMFHTLWTRAVAGLNRFATAFLPWSARPGRDRQWYQKQLDEATDPSLIPQEYPSCLVGESRVSSGNGIFVFRDHDIYHKGTAPTLTLGTSLGYRITATPNHEFLLASGEWAPLETLDVGDRVKLLPPGFGSDLVEVPISPGMPILDKVIRIDEDFAEFLGVFMGDGSISKQDQSGCYTLSVTFDAQDRDSIERMKGRMVRLFGVASERVTGKKKGCIELRVNSRYFGPLFRSLGLIRATANGKIQRKVHVPRFIFRGPKSVIAAFLRGLFDADGFIGYRVPTVKLFSRHEEFIRDVQVLLLGFGITSKLTVEDRTAGDGHTCTGRSLTLRKQEARAYMAEIGFLGARKNGRWSDVPDHRNDIPMVLEDEVASIVPGEESPVYDMEVIPHHYYSANGFWVHNSPTEAFLVSGRTRFQPGWIAAQAAHVLPGLPGSAWPAEFRGIDGLTVYVLPGPWPGRPPRIVLPADVAEGLERGDYSTAPVLAVDRDGRRVEELACLHGRWEPDEFAERLATLAEAYDGSILVERNNHGHAVLTTLRRLCPGRVLDGPDGRPGWATTPATKPQAIDALAVALRDGVAVVRSQATLDEMQIYRVFSAGRTGAPEDGYDDRVMSWAILMGQLAQPEALPAVPVRTRSPLAGFRGTR